MISEREGGFTIMESSGHGGYLRLEIQRHGGIPQVGFLIKTEDVSYRLLLPSDEQ